MNQNQDSDNTAGAVAPAAPCSGSSSGDAVKPLKFADWFFPLGSCHARLIIEADKIGEIEPEDMDALCELAAILKRQLERRKSRIQNTQTQPPNP